MLSIMCLQDANVNEKCKTFIQYPNRNYYKKFGDYGIRGPINNWLNMFLANRKMKVVVEREQSREVIFASGVP
jgi:phosphomannomutase